MRKEPERESSLLESEIAAHLLKAAENGAVVASDERHGGLHGTSIEMLELLMQKGVLVQKGGNDLDYGAGEIELIPTPGLIIPTLQIGTSSAINLLFDEDEAEEAARGYANGNAQAHSFLRNLGITLEKREDLEQAYKLAYASAMDGFAFDLNLSPEVSSLLSPEEDAADGLEHFLEKGFAINRIAHAMRRALPRQGFLLGISPEIQDLPGVMIQPASKNNSEMVVSTPAHGLPYKYISGIEPLGPREEKFLEDLRKRI